MTFFIFLYNLFYRSLMDFELFGAYKAFLFYTHKHTLSFQIWFFLKIFYQILWLDLSHFPPNPLQDHNLDNLDCMYSKCPYVLRYHGHLFNNIYIQFRYFIFLVENDSVPNVLNLNICFNIFLLMKTESRVTK